MININAKWNDSPCKVSKFYSLCAYHFKFYQTQNHLTITLGYNDTNISVFDNDTDSHSIIMDRNMYLGHPYGYNAANVTISNLLITASNSHEPNAFNYNSDAENRWEIISGSWI